MVFFSCSRSGMVDSMSVTLGSCLTCLPSPDPFIPFDWLTVGGVAIEGVAIGAVGQTVLRKLRLLLGLLLCEGFVSLLPQSSTVLIGEDLDRWWWKTASHVYLHVHVHCLTAHQLQQMLVFFLSFFLWFKWSSSIV